MDDGLAFAMAFTAGVAKPMPREARSTMSLAARTCARVTFTVLLDT
jgi:hypothetical protein